MHRIYIPAVYVLNKIDSISIQELDLIYKIPNAVPISSQHGWNFDELLETMWSVSIDQQTCLTKRNRVKDCIHSLTCVCSLLETGFGPHLHKTQGQVARL
jgi:ribosome-interacting GTPase 1